MGCAQAATTKKATSEKFCLKQEEARTAENATAPEESKTASNPLVQTVKSRLANQDFAKISFIE